MVLLRVVDCSAYISITWKVGIKEKLGEVLLGIGLGTTPLDSLQLTGSGRRILVDSIKRRLWIGQDETIRLNVCYYR